jgi:hypothetical protein
LNQILILIVIKGEIVGVIKKLPLVIGKDLKLMKELESWIIIKKKIWEIWGIIEILVVIKVVKKMDRIYLIANCLIIKENLEFIDFNN